MEDKAIRGVPWSLLSFGANRVVTLLTTLVLARLLVPEDFGVFALAVLFVAVFTLLGELGLGSAMVLRQDLDDRARGTVLTLMLSVSALLAVVVLAGAPLAAELFDEPRLTGPLRVLSVVVLLFGLTWFYDVSLQRELEFRTRFIAQATQTTVYAAVALTAAAADQGVWALVFGQLAGTVAWAGALLASARTRIRPAFDRTVARTVLGSGRGFMAQGGLAFVKQNGDYAVVGHALGSGGLGVYSLAFRLAELPYWAIADPVAKVTFPAFARMRERGEDVSDAFLTTLQLVALVATPAAVLLSGAAEPFTRAVLGERWLEITGPLTVLALWGAVRPVHSTTGWLLNSIGRPGLLARVSAATLTLMLPGLILAATLSGLQAVAWVVLAEMVVAALVLAGLVARHAGVPLRRQWRALRPVLVAAPAAWLATSLIAHVAVDLPAAACLLVSLAAGTLAYAGALQLVEPGLAVRVLGQARRIASRGPAAGLPS